jgi:hypothetical protein
LAFIKVLLKSHCHALCDCGTLQPAVDG